MQPDFCTPLVSLAALDTVTCFVAAKMGAQAVSGLSLLHDWVENRYPDLSR